MSLNCTSTQVNNEGSGEPVHSRFLVRGFAVLTHTIDLHVYGNEEAFAIRTCNVDLHVYGNEEASDWKSCSCVFEGHLAGQTKVRFPIIILCPHWELHSHRMRQRHVVCSLIQLSIPTKLSPYLTVNMHHHHMAKCIHCYTARDK